MLHKHLKPHSFSNITQQDLAAQKLFVALCAALCGLVLFHVAQEIPAARWSSILAITAGLAYAARQAWKLTSK